MSKDGYYGDFDSFADEEAAYKKQLELEAQEEEKLKAAAEGENFNSPPTLHG